MTNLESFTNKKEKDSQPMSKNSMCVHVAETERVRESQRDANKNLKDTKLRTTSKLTKQFFVVLIGKKVDKTIL